MHEVNALSVCTTLLRNTISISATINDPENIFSTSIENVPENRRRNSSVTSMCKPLKPYFLYERDLYREWVCWYSWLCRGILNHSRVLAFMLHQQLHQTEQILICCILSWIIIFYNEAQPLCVIPTINDPEHLLSTSIENEPENRRRKSSVTSKC